MRHRPSESEIYPLNLVIRPSLLERYFFHHDIPCFNVAVAVANFPKNLKPYHELSHDYLRTFLVHSIVSIFPVLVGQGLSFTKLHQNEDEVVCLPELPHLAKELRPFWVLLRVAPNIHEAAHFHQHHIPAVPLLNFYFWHYFKR